MVRERSREVSGLGFRALRCIPRARGFGWIRANSRRRKALHASPGDASGARRPDAIQHIVNVDFSTRPNEIGTGAAQEWGQTVPQLWGPAKNAGDAAAVMGSWGKCPKHHQAVTKGPLTQPTVAHSREPAALMGLGKIADFVMLFLKPAIVRVRMSPAEV